MFKKIGTFKADKNKEGQDFLKGGITVNGKSVPIHIYPNKHKHSENDPDYVAYKWIGDKMK